MKDRKLRGLLSLSLVLLMVFSVAPGFAVTAAAGQARAGRVQAAEDTGAGQAQVTKSAVESETPAAAEHEIVVLYTNDVHCGVDENIGYAGLALYKRQMKAETPYVTLVDAGDAIQGAPIGTLSDGGYLIDMMNQLEYDFAVPGNHEFDYGMPRLLELSGKLSCGYDSCNFEDLRTGKPVFKPYRIFQYGGTKVAYVGVCTPESFTKSTPAYFQDAQGNYIYGFCEDETGEKLYGRVQSSVDSARAEGADYVILVGHLGENGVTERWSSDRVLAETSGIDACIDGHSHETITAKAVKNKNGENVILTQTGTKLAQIGKLTIGTDGRIRTELIAKVPGISTQEIYTVQKDDSLSRIAKRRLGSYNRWEEIYRLNRNVLPDPDALRTGMQLVIPGSVLIREDGTAVDYETDTYIRSLQAQFSEALKTVLGHTDYQLTTLNLDTGYRAIRNSETNLGDLCADAFRVELGADVGLMNGGGIRADVKAGNITYNDTLAVFPYGNMGCVAKVTGRQLKDALEMASKNYPEESGGFLQVSGLTYRIDSSVPSGVKIDEKGNFVKVEGDYRVKDIKVGGEPLDPDAAYTVASHNYLLKLGGDGMTMFQGCSMIRDEVMTDVDMLSDYINTHLGGNVGADYANPAGQGRIVIE